MLGNGIIDANIVRTDLTLLFEQRVKALRNYKNIHVCFRQTNLNREISVDYIL